MDCDRSVMRLHLYRIKRIATGDATNYIRLLMPGPYGLKPASRGLQEYCDALEKKSCNMLYEHDALTPRPARRQGPSQAGERMERQRFRMSDAMAYAISTAAKDAGLTAPAWLRGLVADRLGMSSPADRQPVQAYGGGGPDAAALTALRLQLRQTGGLITQGAKEARLAGIPTHPDLEDALAQVRQALTLLMGWQSVEAGPP